MLPCYDLQTRNQTKSSFRCRRETEETIGGVIVFPSVVVQNSSLKNISHRSFYSREHRTKTHRTPSKKKTKQEDTKRNSKTMDSNDTIHPTRKTPNASVVRTKRTRHRIFSFPAENAKEQNPRRSARKTGVERATARRGERRTKKRRKVAQNADV